eukprot:Phypoly_transcript_20336.p1 GENE.Phypoly_transcript_20336~~Phypoly_transcript_20336.p1  ORF type:complete len:216 (+),score=13.76 Phypoly_transcript_20336:35-649(+)
MKLYSILVFRWPLRNGQTSPKLVASGFEVSSFGMFERGSVKEWAVFFGRTLVQNAQPGSRSTIQHEDYGCHVQVRHDGLSGVFITDKEYVPRSAFVLLGQLLDEFCSRYKGEWEALADPKTPQVDFPKIKEMLVKCQSSGEADRVATVMNLIDETTIIMHKNIETALANGQKLESLVDKSEDLSRHSKVFYKQAKKANRCCTIS